MTYNAHALATQAMHDHMPSGERRLMLATLEDGIRTIIVGAHRPGSRKRVQEDLDWLTNDDPRPAFSFHYLCDVLGIDADYLRARVLAARARESAGSR